MAYTRHIDNHAFDEVEPSKELKKRVFYSPKCKICKHNAPRKASKPRLCNDCRPLARIARWSEAAYSMLYKRYEEAREDK